MGLSLCMPQSPLIGSKATNSISRSQILQASPRNQSIQKKRMTWLLHSLYVIFLFELKKILSKNFHGALSKKPILYVWVQQTMNSELKLLLLVFQEKMSIYMFLGECKPASVLKCVLSGIHHVGAWLGSIMQSGPGYLVGIGRVS